MRRLVAQRQERRHRAVEAEPVATGFRREQEPEQEAEAPEAGHAEREAVEAGQAASVQGEGGGKGRRRYVSSPTNSWWSGNIPSRIHSSSDENNLVSGQR